MHDNNIKGRKSCDYLSSCRKAFDGNQHPFKIKILRKVKIE